MTSEDIKHQFIIIISRITCKSSESAREQRIALLKSDQQALSVLSKILHSEYILILCRTAAEMMIVSSLRCTGTWVGFRSLCVGVNVASDGTAR